MITWKKSTCVHLCLQQNQKMIMPQKAQIQIALLDTPVTHEKQSHPEPQEIVCFNPDEIRETNVKFPSLCNFCLARPFTCTLCCLSSQLRYVHQCNLTAFASWKTTVSAEASKNSISIYLGQTSSCGWDKKQISVIDIINFLKVAKEIGINISLKLDCPKR